MFDLLKHNIELKFRQKIQHQIDCKNLSISIHNSINKSVSTSTLRRLFGFLPTNSQPNRNTLDALCEYCGFESWEQFQLQANAMLPLPNLFDYWGDAQKKAQNISLQFCKNFYSKKNALPTINRHFADERIKAFLAQNQSNATALVGPGGFGKTTVLVKWYEKASGTRDFAKDIILMLPATALEPCIKFDLRTEIWLSSALGLPSDFFSNLTKNSLWKWAPGKIIVIIDGIDEVHVFGSKAAELTAKLKRFTEEVMPANNIRFIFTSRLADWHELFGDTSGWFMLHNSSYSELGANMPPFNDFEIQQIFDLTINGKHGRNLMVEVFSEEFRRTISYPYYLQILLEIIDPGTSPHLRNRLVILRDFLKKQVYQSDFSDEKADLLYKIVELTDFGRIGSSVRKNDIRDCYPIHLKMAGNYFNAYSDLLSFGIIREDLVENRYGTFVKMVSIASSPIFELLIAQKLIEFHGGVSHKLFEKIEKEYSGNKILPFLISLLFEIAYEERAVEALVNFFDLNVSTLEQALKLSTIQHCLRRDEYMRRQLLPVYSCNANARQLFFERYIDLNYITTSYTYLAECYLKANTCNASEVKVRTLQIFSDFMLLNIDKVKEDLTFLFAPATPVGLNPLIAGIWFSNRMFSVYFNLAQTPLAIDDEIEHYFSANIQANGFETQEMFEIGLSYGLILTKRFDFIALRLNRFFSKVTEIVTPNHKFLYIIYLYAQWMLGHELTAKEVLQIEGYTNDLPYWCSFQPIILAYTMLAAKNLSSSHPEKAYESFKKASEISSNAGYKLYEVKQLKNLSIVLHKLGEKRKAAECEDFAKSKINTNIVAYDLL